MPPSSFGAFDASALTRSRAKQFAAFIGLAAGLAGCAQNVDAEQARLCRLLLPALMPTDGLRVLAEGSVGTTLTLRFRRDVGPAQSLACTFAGTGFDPAKREIRAVVLNGDVLGEGARFFLLGTWLRDPLAAASDPGPPQAAPLLGQWPRNAALAAQHGLGALPHLGVYALIASAYALLYGLIGRLNLAFGECAALGGIGATLVVVLTTVMGASGIGLTIFLALGAALALTGLAGAAMSRLVFAPLVRRPGQQVLVASVGLAIALQEMLRLSQGSGTRWLAPVLNQTWVIAASDDFLVSTSPMPLIAAAISGTAALGLLATLGLTRFGRAWRACADDPIAAALCGIDPGRILAATLALSAALAGLAGAVVALAYGGMGFAGGASLGLMALIGAVAGGIGSAPGAMLGGVAIGVLETAWSALLPIALKDAALFLLLAFFFVVRPGGLFGFAEGGPRRV